MLEISRAQFERFEATAIDEAVPALGAILAADYPHLFDRFPPHVWRAIVFNMLGRAYARGIEEMEAAEAFCCLMLEVAPNFDDHPVIEQALTLPWLPPDEAILELEERAGPTALARAAEIAEDLALFTPPHLIGASLAERTTAALPLILWDEVDAAAAPGWAAWGLGMAAFWGMEGLADAPATLAACRVLYGPAFPDRMPWLQEVRQESAGDVRMALALIKARAMIDHERFV